MGKRRRKQQPAASATATPRGSRVSADVCLSVHRCRFINFVPDAVQALAATQDGSILAVGRLEGDVELLLPSEKYRVQCRIAGSRDAALRALEWYEQPGEKPRLLGCSLKGTVFEVDTQRLSYSNVCDSYGGAAWCLAVSPADQVLAVGCEDGSVKLFSLADGSLEYWRTLPTTHSRVLSLGWRKDGSAIFTGGADSHVRCFHAKTGQVMFHVRAEAYGGGETLIWCMRTLSDGTVLTGDSLGRVTFWDGELGTQLQSLASHEGDIFAIAVSEDERTVFVSGADSKVTALTWMRGSVAAPTEVVEDEALPDPGRWVFTHAHRPHTHDVHALVTLKAPRSEGEILVSGGIDAKLCLYGVKKFALSRPVREWPFPHRQIAFLSPARRRLMIARSTSLEVWRLAPGAHHDAATSADTADGVVLPGGDEPPLLELEINLREGSHIACAAFSKDGLCAAASTADGLKVFRLEESGPRKVRMTEDCDIPAHQLVLSHDGGRLAASGQDGAIRLMSLGLVNGALKSSLVHKFDFTTQRATPVPLLCMSADGQWLAAASLSGEVQVYSLDALAHHWTLPSLNDCCSGMTFFGPTGVLVVMMAKGGFVLMDVEEKCMVEWSQDVGVSMTALPPGQKPFLSAAFNPSSPSTMILHNHTLMCYIDLESDVPKSPRFHPKHHLSAKFKPDVNGADLDSMISPTLPKRSQRGHDGTKNISGESATSLTLQKNFTVNLRYRPMLMVDFAGPEELVVVENPWLKVVSQLPDALYRPQYGT
jgi:U3 small nucleolar RNA-associated protein 4